MRLKQIFFSRLAPWAAHYRVFKVLSVGQLLVCIVIPIGWPELNTGYWFLSFTLFVFWLSNYAIARLIYHHDANMTGIKGWFARQWESALFLIWLLTASATFIFAIKLALFVFNEF